jgi:hypothetical protein
MACKVGPIIVNGNTEGKQAASPCEVYKVQERRASHDDLAIIYNHHPTATRHSRHCSATLLQNLPRLLLAAVLLHLTFYLPSPALCLSPPAS